MAGPSSATESRELPPLVKAWSQTRRLRFRGRGTVGAHLVRRLIAPEEVYRSPEGHLLTIDPDDPFQAWILLGMYEERLTASIAEHAAPGSVALDIGSHIGLHALVMARGVGRDGQVHAFDPDPRAYGMLVRHLELNDVPQVVANQAAVGDQPGSIDLRVSGQLGWSSTKPIKAAAETIRVPAVSIDAYLDERQIAPERVSVIKLDVESAELDALRGMRSLLAVGAPATIVEVVPDRPYQRAEQIYAFMDELGYGSEPTDFGLIFTRSARR